MMLCMLEKKPIPGFFDEAVYPNGKSRQLVFHGVSTRRSRPLVSGALGRWRLSLSRFAHASSFFIAVLKSTLKISLKTTIKGSLLANLGRIQPRIEYSSLGIH